MGAFVGSLFVSTIAERLGRKNGILLANVPSAVGTILVSVWPSTGHFELLVAGRFMIGCHVGLSSGLQPLFLTEIAPRKFRGILCALQELCVVSVVAFGTIVGLPEALGTESRFVLLLAFPAIPTVLHTVCVLFFYETPKHLLLTVGNSNKAEKAVRFFSGTAVDSNEAIEEIEKEAKSTSSKSRDSAGCFRAPFSVKMAISVGVIAGVAQTCTGIIGLENFSTSMFVAAGISNDHAKYATIGITVTNALAAIAALGAVHRVGRRWLLLFTMAGTMVCNCVYATFGRLACSWCGYPSVAAYVIHTIFFSFGIGPIPWFLAAELVPQAYRSIAQGSASVAIWLSTIVTGAAFYPLSKIETIGPLAVLIVYVAPTVFCGMFLLVFMPETRGRDIGEITKNLERRRIEKKTKAHTANEIRCANGDQREQYV